MTRHPAAAHWGPAVGAMNLRELASRPERFEHHLVVIARIGDVQLELAAASEPLYFGHINISDEYALALPSGDELVDRFPLRTFLSDRGADVGRYNHAVGDLVLHPLGLMHWPGKLRPPYAPLAIPPGMRRTGLTLVYCASVPTPSAGVIAPGGDGAKAYVSPPPPMSIVDTRTASGVVAAIADTTLELAAGAIAPPRGGWVLDLATLELRRLAAGERVELPRALVFASRDREPEPVPPAWTALPPPPFAVYEDAAPGTLPLEHGELRIEARDDAFAAVTIAGATVEVPRYWLARTLFRLALHGLRLGHIECYGGLAFDDRAELVVGAAGRTLAIPRGEALAFVERAYRAVAPPGYVERLA